MPKPKPGTAPTLKSNVELLPLEDLHLDRENPRFGGTVSSKASETDLLDTIVEKFGADDLLSSLAMNGYFGSEPLVGFRPKGTKSVTIAEGNRRLAACLILEKDPRAQNQSERSERFGRPDRPKISQIPVLVYEDKSELLAFMGVRHIAAQNPWDSYAKAHWVAQMLDENKFTLDEITNMIGDQYNTVERMLEGYYFVNQLKQADKWDARESMRPGRGSNPLFPFSWVYTALGYAALRKWLGLSSDRVKKEPVPKDNLDAAAEVLDMMFGNRAKKFNPSISDSREIIGLASALADARQLGVLRKGAPLSRAIREGFEPGRRIEDEFINSRESLREANSVLTGTKLNEQEARRLQPLSQEVRKLAVAADKLVLKAVTGDEESDE